MIDRLVRFSERYRRALTVLGAVWLALGTAVYARFIRLPEIPLAYEVFLFSGAAYNAMWWGFLRPAIERRRSELAQSAITGEGTHG